MFKKGDIFCTISPHTVLGKGIQFIQKARTIGTPSAATHSGIFLDENTVVESHWKVERNNVWDEYEGTDFLVGRWIGMTDEKFDKAWEGLKKYEGKFYPVPRLLMFALTPIMVQLISPSKWLGLGFFSDIVCSEFACKILYKCGWEQFKAFRGLTPAHVAHRIRQWRDMEIIHDKAPLKPKILL